jgi:hypothetical protein
VLSIDNRLTELLRALRLAAAAAAHSDDADSMRLANALRLVLTPESLHKTDSLVKLRNSSTKHSFGYINS